MDSVLFFLLMTIVIHAAYGLGVVRRTRKLMRGQKQQFEKRLHIMAHSLYTPIGSIRNFTELLSSEKVQKNQQRMIEYTDIIDENVVRMLETIRYYIDISRIENNTFDLFVRDYSLAAIVEERLHFYGSRALKSSVILSMDIGRNLPDMTACDSRAVSHMIDRMLSCMIERSSAGNRVSVGIFPIQSGESIQKAAEHSGVSCTFDNQAMPESRTMAAVTISTTHKIFSDSEFGTLFTDAVEDLKTADTKEFTAAQLLRSHHVGLMVVKRWAEAHGGSAGAWLCEENSVLYFTLPQTTSGTERLVKSAE